jgi:hypothetical protein
VDGVDQLYQQWFWYRVGATGAEASIDTISAPTVSAIGRVADITYANALFQMSITYTLTGGTAGSATADIAETIRIINLTSNDLDFHFFQYSDFDLNGTSGQDTVTITAAHNTVRQTGIGQVLSETVVGPTPNHWEVGLFPDTRDKLNDGSPTTLDDSFGPLFGDATWAFEWDQTIAGGGTFLISKDKRLAPVPLPPSVLLLGSGLLGLVGLRWRRARKIS